jgi:tetratricopeptide (TPR) repeat protein
MKISHCRVLGLCVLLVCLGAGAGAQTRRAPASLPKIDVENYALDVTLKPDDHELTATAKITFKALEQTDTVLFEISENLSIQKIVDETGVEVLFGQEEAGPGLLSVHFARPLNPDQRVTITVEYEAGFDRDRYTRNYTRDESTAYIGPEGSYLIYPAKWFPVNDFLVDRAAATVEITVPLGMTAIGPGEQLPVVTKGINEKFGWAAKGSILPNSIVVGQFFERKVQAAGTQMTCFATEDHLGAMEKVAEAAGKIIEYYQRAFGPASGGSSYRLVEVDDRVKAHHGTLGMIFVPSQELAGKPFSIRDLARRVAYQWWMETVGARSRGDLWLVDGLAYYSAALYLAHADGPQAFKAELNDLEVLALKFESKSPIRNGYELGYKSESYQSVVAGKGAWVLNMLRELIGEPKFVELLQRYLSEDAGPGGSTAAFEKLAESIYGKDLRWFFAQWVDTMGVPVLQTDYVIFRTIDGFRVSGTVSQDRDLFRMPLDVEVISKGGVQSGSIVLDGKSTPFDIETATLPERVVLDPGGKVLRDSPELQIAVQLSLGMELKEKGDFVEAVRAFENALKKNPRSSLAHFRMAEVFFEQFNLNAAADSFRNALNGDKKPAWTEVWSYIYLGKIFDVLGQRQRALAEYNKALNTKDDTNGAQVEAKKWLSAPYTKEATAADAKQPG